MKALNLTDSRPSNNENGYLEFYNRIITNITLTQRRMLLKKNPSSSYEDFVPLVWEADQINVNDKPGKSESTKFHSNNP